MATTTETAAYACDAGNIGPIFIANNTFISGGVYFGSTVNYTLSGDDPPYYALTLKKNIFKAAVSPSPGSYFGSGSNGAPANWLGGLQADNNLYFNDRAALFGLSASSWWGKAATANATTNFETWKSFCSCDAAGANQDPKINADGTLQADSAAVGHEAASTRRYRATMLMPSVGQLATHSPQP